MSRHSIEQIYLKLMRQFADGNLTAIDFAEQFMKLWKWDRDERYKIQDTWPRRLDIELMDQFQQGTITKDQFRAKTIELWGLTNKEFAFNELMDFVFSSCNCLDDPDPRFSLTEDSLRASVKNAMSQLEQMMT